MSHFVGELERNISRHDKNKTTDISIREIPFQKLQPATRFLLEGFPRLRIIRIQDCDLRTLENFPAVATLTHLYLSNNKLQGSFHHLRSLKELRFLDVSKNLILKASACYPLRSLDRLTIRVEENPFVTIDQDWKELLRSYKLVIDEQAQLQLTPAVKETSIRPRLDASAQQRKAKVLKRLEGEDRGRERNYQQTLENLISMVQMTNSAFQSEIGLSRRENLRWPNCSVEDVEELQQPMLRGARSHLENSFNMFMSPRDHESRRLLTHAMNFRGDVEVVDDRFDVPSDQY